MSLQIKKSFREVPLLRGSFEQLPQIENDLCFKHLSIGYNLLGVVLSTDTGMSLDNSNSL